MDLQFDLSELKTPSDYRAEGRTHVFPSAGSLEWFIRKHKVALIKEKALLRPTRKIMVNPPLFDKLVLSIGSQNIDESKHEFV